MSKPLFREDLAHILTHARATFSALAGARIFLTGGTGFFGHWLLESLLHANRELSLDVHATVLTRNAAAFRAKSPHIANDPAVALLEGDAGSFAFPSQRHTHILHAATDSGSPPAHLPPYTLAESILGGTRRVLQFARATGAARFLYVSTGAVYGRSTTLLHTPETYLGAPDPLLLQSSYDEAKRMSENLCIAYSAGADFEAVVARCFAFVGPHLPLDRHFAIGNFIGAALAHPPIPGGCIHITGDGTPRRSWLYMADLSIWLWTMLVRGHANRAYNVGSDEAYSVAEAARLTAATLHPGMPIQIDGSPTPGAPLNSYVPSIARARDELGLRVTVPLAEAIRRTAAWYE